MENCLRPEQSELGQKSQYESHYNPDKLFPIARKHNREAIGIHSLSLPFYGFDYWNHYEVSWLNEKGKPMVALAELIYGCDSQFIIESKSMKLYFNSFNNTRFKDVAALVATIKADIEKRIAATLIVRITPLHLLPPEKLLPQMSGISIDQLDIPCSVYHVDPTLLTTETTFVTETLCTDLLKSNCLVTQQPDWCSVQIVYKGHKINREGLLRYIVSFRDDHEFHEQCIEKIFMHVMDRCRPVELTIYGRSTRRGGLDINPCRSTSPIDPLMLLNPRLYRQ